ncbi:MAG: ABC transporter permease subunit [Anaerolineales bacterium]|nr:ABC transporter permease subunit [Anaerolineales bacterium]
MATLSTKPQEVSLAQPPARRKRPFRKQLNIALRYVVLTLVGLLVFMPFILSFFGTFKTNAEIIAFPPTLLPEEWLLQNWPDLFDTDLGGLPRPEGTTSVGLTVGLFAFYLTFLLTGMSSEQKGRGLPRRVGLPAAVLLVLAAGYGVGLYLQNAYEASLTLRLTAGTAVGALMLILLGIIAMSEPDWQRVLIALAGSILVGALVTALFTQLATLAGGGRFLRWFFNTALLSVIRAFLQLIFCSMAAYAFARLKFPGKGLIFGFMLASMMLPGAVTLIPGYIVIAKLEWINKWFSLVFPGIVIPFGIFLLTQFLRAIPRDLEEAAFMDGASYFQIYKDVILPLARPALLTLFILQFQAMWNDYLTPLLYLNTPDMWVLNVALQVFQQNFKAEWNLVLVGAMVNAVPVLILFFFFSRYYIEGVSYAGVKG